MAKARHAAHEGHVSEGLAAVIGGPTASTEARAEPADEPTDGA